MKDMKIRLTRENEDAVRKALQAAGHNLEGTQGEGKIYLYTYHGTSEAYYGRDGAHFKDHKNPEYILTPQGTLMPAAEYYTYPETEYVKRFPCEGCRPGDCTGCGEDSPKEEVCTPLPIPPFSQWVSDRMRLITEHISYNLANKLSVDNKLTRELHVLNVMLRDFEEGK